MAKELKGEIVMRKITIEDMTPLQRWSMDETYRKLLRPTGNEPALLPSKREDNQR